MKRFLKIIGSVFSTVVLLAIVVPVLAALLFSVHAVQNYAADRFAAIVSKRLDTRVEVGNVRVHLFNRVVIEQFYVEDLQGDTLIYAGRIDVGFKGYSPVTGTVRLGDVILEEGNFFLAQDSLGVMNLRYLIDKLKSDKPKTSKRPFRLRSNSLVLKDFHFKYRKFAPPEKPYGMNYADLDVDRIDLEFQRLDLENDSIRVGIKHLAAVEKCGFVLENFSAREAVVSGTGIRLSDFRVKSDPTDVEMAKLDFTYDRWNAFRNFISRVNIEADLGPSDVAFSTIAYFAPSLAEWETRIRAEGRVEGPVADLGGTLTSFSTRDTKGAVKFRITGLPDIENTRFDVDLNPLETTVEDVRFLYSDIVRKPADTFAGYLDPMRRITLHGKFEGSFSDFSTEGRLQGAAGEVVFNARMHPQGGRSAVEGDVSIRDFSLGSVLGIKEMGSATLVANASGTLGDSMLLDTRVRVDRLDFRGYAYHGIDLKAEVRNKYYHAALISDDPNLDLRLDGTFDTGREVPRYNFSLDATRIDLARLHLNTRDSVSVLSGVLRANAEGLIFDEMTGSGSLRNLTYRFGADTIQAGEIRLEANNVGGNKLVGVYSDFVDAELRSRLSYSDMLPYFRNTLAKYLPALSAGKPRKANAPIVAETAAARTAAANDPGNYYVLTVNVKEPNLFAGALVSGLYVADGTKASFMFNPLVDNFSLTLNSEYIEYRNMYLSNLYLTGRNESDSISLNLQTEELSVGRFLMPGFSVNGGAKENGINLAVGFVNTENNSSALINLAADLAYDSIARAQRATVRFNPSQFTVQDQVWRIVSPRIVFDPSGIDVERLRIISTGQELAAYGKLSRTEGDTLHVEMNNLDLSPLTSLIDRMGFRIAGRTNGHADIVAAADQQRLFSADLAFDDLAVNGKPIPRTVFSSWWDNSVKRLRISMASGQDTLVRGSYMPSDQRYYVDINFPNLDLSYIQPFLTGVLSGIEGEAAAKLRLTGTGKKPLLNGSIAVPTFGATVDYTKVHYSLRDATVDVVNNDLILRRTRLRDDESGTANIEMTLRMSKLSNLTYDLRIVPNKMLALNTTERDNDLFYGKAYASGSVTIRGDKRKVAMNIVATTENNSTFVMPLSDKMSIEEADFIVFEDFLKPKKEDTVLTRKQLFRERQRRTQSSSKSAMEIDMTVNVQPNTKVKLVIDPRTGDQLEATGTGNLSLRIRPADEVFTMNGTYEIREGTYFFPLKHFTIEPGSTIQWTGNPVDALLNITAVYPVRGASLASLVGTATGGAQKVNVNCIIMLTDRLTKPTISFDVKVPRADIETQSIIQSALNTQEMKSDQFIWLLMTGGFHSDATSNANIGTAATASTGIEFLTNQLSSWVSSDRTTFNFGYRPGTDLSSDEAYLAYSQEIIPDKLLIETEGNFDMGNNPNSITRASGPITGDFYITYVIDPQGNLRTKVFTRTVERFDENQGLQESGVGLYYKVDFNTYKELWDRYFKRREKQPAALPEAEDAPIPETRAVPQENPAASPASITPVVPADSTAMPVVPADSTAKFR